MLQTYLLIYGDLELFRGIAYQEIPKTGRALYVCAIGAVFPDVWRRFLFIGVHFMTAFVIVEVTEKDSQKKALYSAAAGPSIASHGGHILARGPVTYLHMGDNFTNALIIQFPSADAARRWYNSPEYAGTHAIRNEAFDSRFVLIG